MPPTVQIARDDIGKTIDVTVGQTVDLTLAAYAQVGWEPLVVSPVGEPAITSTGVLKVVSVTNPTGGALQATLLAVAPGKVVAHAEDACLGGS